jgi:hypothetical protein
MEATDQQKDQTYFLMQVGGGRGRREGEEERGGRRGEGRQD